MAFLQSVLPDMKDHQKRKFKMGILNLAERVLEQSASNHSTGSGSHSREVIAPSRFSVLSLESVNTPPTCGTLSTLSANSTDSGQPGNEALISTTENITENYTFNLGEFLRYRQ
jgi:hypothetical protein